MCMYVCMYVCIHTDYIYYMKKFKVLFLFKYMLILISFHIFFYYIIFR